MTDATSLPSGEIAHQDTGSFDDLDRAEFAVARPHRGRLIAPDPVLKHERQGRWKFGWLLLAIILVPIIVVLVNLGAIWALEAVARFRGETAMFETALTLEDVAPGNPYAFAMLVLVGLGFAVPVLIMSRISRGRWWNALTYDAPFRWYNFVKAATAFALLAAIGTAYGLATSPENYRITEIFTSPPPDYAIWFGVGLLAILIQSFGEELMFRGYLPRLFGAVIPFRLLIVGAIIALFVSLHAANPDVKIDLWFIVILFLVMEIVNFTILFRTRSIAATWGIHWMNNSFIFLMLSSEPGRVSSMVPFVYTDPIWSASGSRLYDPTAYLEFGAGLAIFCVLLFWKWSPFYLPWHDEPQ